MPFLPVHRLLSDLAGALSGLGKRWYLFGAQAVIVHGRPRASADVDVTTELDLEKLPLAIQALQRAGFDLRIEDPVGFVSETRVLPLVHRDTHMPLDLVIAGPGLEQGFLERAVLIDLGGGERFPVIAPSDLVVTKILGGRPKDLDDAQGILDLRLSELDVEAMREMLSLLDQALDRSDLLACLEAMIAGAKATPRQ